MALKKAESWTDIYYSSIEEYFWRPQAIGRKADPTATPKPWSHWRSKLSCQEVALNHILDFLFHIAPPELLEDIIEKFVGRKIKDIDLVSTPPGLIDEGVVQPDIVLSNGETLTFIEMKVDSKSSIDQFAKYLIAAHCIMRADESIKSVDLIMMCAHTNFQKIWKKSKTHGIKSASDLRQVVKRGLSGDDSIWSERGVNRFVSANPNSIESLIKLADKVALHVVNYECLAAVLRRFASDEPTALRLIQGAILELERRGLVETKQLS